MGEIRDTSESRRSPGPPASAEAPRPWSAPQWAVTIVLAGAFMGATLGVLGTLVLSGHAFLASQGEQAHQRAIDRALDLHEARQRDQQLEDKVDEVRRQKQDAARHAEARVRGLRERAERAESAAREQAKRAQQAEARAASAEARAASAEARAESADSCRDGHQVLLRWARDLLIRRSRRRDKPAGLGRLANLPADALEELGGAVRIVDTGADSGRLTTDELALLIAITRTLAEHGLDLTSGAEQPPRGDQRRPTRGGPGPGRPPSWSVGMYRRP